jgi:hypothetical protein
MAKASLEIIEILRRTASRIETSADYQWGHMGSCNCGFLVQEVTNLKKEEIHARALQRFGDWNEQLNDYCPSSGLPMDDLIRSIIDAGFDMDDLKHLEKLSDPAILRHFPAGENTLRFNVRSDVVKYLRAWAHLKEQEIVREVELPHFIHEAPMLLSQDR